MAGWLCCSTHRRSDSVRIGWVQHWLAGCQAGLSHRCAGWGGAAVGRPAVDASRAWCRYGWGRVRAVRDEEEGGQGAPGSPISPDQPNLMPHALPLDSCVGLVCNAAVCSPPAYLPACRDCRRAACSSCGGWAAAWSTLSSMRRTASSSGLCESRIGLAAIFSAPASFCPAQGCCIGQDAALAVRSEWPVRELWG